MKAFANSRYVTLLSFVYGGWNNGHGMLDDVWVLTIPGFRWFQAQASSSPRQNHACARISAGQIVSVGGWIEGPDPLPHGIGVFDMTKMAWVDRYDADSDEYRPMENIRDWYDERYVLLSDHRLAIC